MSQPDVPLLLGSALLLLVAGWDIARRRIPNWANAALGTTGLLVQLLTHGATAALSGLGAALITLAFLWTPWTKGRLGGGDVKATLCAAIWMGLSVLMEFYIYTALAVGVLAVICLVGSSARARREIADNLKLVAMQAGLPDAPIRGGQGRMSVPFGAAASAAALILLWWR